LSGYVGPIYDNPTAVADLDVFRAWGSTLAYTFQLYFDFSGYSDMAVGSARLFGIRLPVNFFSPYKAQSIVEFWRRWHISLSRFLRDYLYIALGGNKKGKVRRYINLFLTMLLGGLWHGAGWPFVIWGALHGVYLIINHAWQRLLALTGINPHSHRAYKVASWMFTFLAVVVGWVYFRAPTLEQGNSILLAMFGANGAQLPTGIMSRLGESANLLNAFGVTPGPGSASALFENYVLVILASVVALFLPNVAQIFQRHEPVLYERPDSFERPLDGTKISWKLSIFWAIFTAMLFVLGVMTLSQVSEFLYFQF
jgi:hypothetical protein